MCYYFTLSKTCSWSLGKIRIVDKKPSIWSLVHQDLTQVKMYLSLFFLVLFHHSFPLEYAFTCQIFVRCSEKCNSFQERHMLQACNFTVKGFTLDALLVFSSCYINSFLLDQLLGCILSFWGKQFMQVALCLLFAYTSH